MWSELSAKGDRKEGEQGEKVQELYGNLKGAAGGIESLFQPVASSGFPKCKEAGKVNNMI